MILRPLGSKNIFVPLINSCFCCYGDKVVNIHISVQLLMKLH